jgi:hypothetical protein
VVRAAAEVVGSNDVARSVTVQLQRVQQAASRDEKEAPALRAPRCAAR